MLGQSLALQERPLSNHCTVRWADSVHSRVKGSSIFKGVMEKEWLVVLTSSLKPSSVRLRLVESSNQTPILQVQL